MDKTAILSRLDFRAFYKTHLPSLKENGKTEAKALCPFHNDTHPSLSVNLSNGLWKCWAGCGGGDLFAFYMRLKRMDFKQAVEEIACTVGVNDNGPGKIVATYEYKDKGGKLLYVKERIEPGENGRSKRFVFKHLAGERWITGRDCEPVPYNLPALAKATYAVVVEGEGKVDLLKGWGLTATSLDTGANSTWRMEYLPYFEGKRVVILPDNDTPGREYAQRIATALHGKAKEVKVVELPGLGEAEDIIDWQRKGGTKEKLLGLIKQAPTWSPPPTKSITLEEEPGLNTLNALNTYTNPWPTLKPEALYGLTGEAVKTIEPHSEADPVALLVNSLACFGNIVGDGPHFVAEADKHPMRIDGVSVGETAKGRKDSAWGRIRKLYALVDPDWAKDHIVSGLSSGEGLVWAVRDPIERTDSVKEKGRITGYQTEVIDQGVEDKRLFVLEPEFSRVLKVLDRDGSTLSPVIRQAWDTGDLKILTKTSPAKATGAHISIVGHITKGELLRYLDNTEAGNGFGNRFLWLCVRRSKCLPEGGGHIDFGPLVGRLKQAVEFAGTIGEIKRDSEAREIWHAVYPTLSDGKPGLFGALTSRAEAYVMRIACIYALLDLSPVIKRVHLEASLALWDYVEESVRYIFGNATGDPMADRIWESLRQNPEGLSRNKIYSSLFGGNVKAERIDRAVGFLLSHGAVEVSQIHTEGAKRPTEFLRVRAT
ncbi:MAG: CHC2 zinc finger domain-containing protein [Candidatus Brocadiales bacterium]|nr:CHC2 zinc finger domain-containing protein [Candidatus Brocadiales bacterium]